MFFDLSKMAAQESYNLLNGLVAPRPIAWVTSMDLDGKLNAAPFSAYNYVGTDPPVVAIGIANLPGPGRIA
jgi:flavin reductase (DIM6/NTAB) family NADH-FMN oxidoreductase RutF